MAHAEWCGKPCGECESPCKLDESIPCSPDCENLFPNGSHNLVECNNAGCDVSKYSICAFCLTEISWDSADEQKGTLWNCDKCYEYFCDSCFKEKHGAKALQGMVCADSGGDILCPNCYGKKAEERVSGVIKQKQ